MRPVLSSSEMSYVDRATIRSKNISSFDLMKEVSLELSERILGLAKPDDEILVLCGPGNNGGDGYCVAEYLRRSKRKVFVLPVFSPASLECKKAARFCKAKKWSRSDTIPNVMLVVDAVFGSGQRPGLSKDLQKLFLNLRKNRSISLDIPSGVSDEFVDSNSFRADQTLGVAYAKKSLFHEKAAEFYGDLLWVGKKFAAPRFTNGDLLEESDFCLKPLLRTAHKSGKVGLVAGSADTPGASFLAAEAAHRMQVGYVHLFFSKVSGFRMKLIDASFLYRMNWKAKDLLSFDQEASAWVLGPGGCSKNVMKILKKSSLPIVLDADALGFESILPRRKNILCTPHPGEAARLLRCSIREVQQNRLGALKELVKKTGKSIYLKGAPGVLQFGGRDPILNYSVSSSLARAGSGDVLSGILGGALARAMNFESGVLSGLLFQKKMGEFLKNLPAAISSDQLQLFSETWRYFWKSSK